MHLYGKDEIRDIPLPHAPFAKSAHAYTLPIMESGSKAYIENVQTDLRLLVSGDLYLPVTINDTEWDNSYVCAPYTHYISYAKEELVRLPNAALRSIFKVILDVLGWILRYGDINRVIIVNNWMLSTNLYPEIAEKDIAAITTYLKKIFPTHAILWRSIQTYRQKDLLSIFHNTGYKEVASRQVYLWDETHPVNDSGHGLRQLKIDEKLLTDSEYSHQHVTELSAVQAERVRELYNMLYLDKYSKFNPQFTEAFFTHAVNSGVFDLTLLSKAGQIEGVVGVLPLEKMVTATIFGYNVSLPPSEKLYRRLSMLALDYARERHWISHASSGAASFKRNRRYVPETEFTMIYIKHLRLKQRVIWKILSILINGIGVPLLRKYEL